MPIEARSGDGTTVATEVCRIAFKAISLVCFRPRRLFIAAAFLWSLTLSITNSRAGLLGTNLFPADNPWNQNISQAPVATN